MSQGVIFCSSRSNCLHHSVDFFRKFWYHFKGGAARAVHRPTKIALFTRYLRTEKESNMIHKLINVLTFSVIVLSTVGCSAVRIVENSFGYGIDRTAVVDTEERRDEFRPRDFQIQFGVTDTDFRFQLQYVPYYKIEQRELVKYRPEATLLELAVGLASTALWGKAIYDTWLYKEKKLADTQVDWDNFDAYDFRFDWEGTSFWNKAIMIGVPVDMFLYRLIGSVRRTHRTGWEQTGEVEGSLQGLRQQEYRIELPAYDFSRKYRTRSGDENVAIRGFLYELKDPKPLLNLSSIDVRASTKVDGKTREETLTIEGWDRLKPFRWHALKVVEGIDMFTARKPRGQPLAEVNTHWTPGSVRAGNTATLSVTVQNSGKGALYRFTTRAVSADSAFNKAVEFGKIAPGESRTLVQRFETSPRMRTQTLPIELRFGEYNGYEPNNEETQLHIIGAPPPKFDYRYPFVDDGSGNSVGNGDGVIQRGEAIDLQITVTNRGDGNAKDVTVRLAVESEQGIELFGEPSRNLGDIIPGASKKVTFNVGVKQNSTAKTLNLNVSITDTFGGADVKKTIELPIVEPPPPPIRQGNALLFAINAYEHWTALANPIPDAKTIAKQLEETYGFQVELVENPSRVQLLDKLREYANRAYRAEEQLFVFFAGRGYFDVSLGKDFIVTRDTKLEAADPGLTSYVSQESLWEILDRVQCQHIFLMIDARFSGTLSSQRRDENGDEPPENINPKTRRYLTFAGKESVPAPFVRKVLEALRSKGGTDRILTLNELLGYVEKVVPKPRYGTFGRDETGSDFLFIAR